MAAVVMADPPPHHASHGHRRLGRHADHRHHHSQFRRQFLRRCEPEHLFHRHRRHYRYRSRRLQPGRYTHQRPHGILRCRRQRHFQITAPGGFFTQSANGNYAISLVANTLMDTAGNAAAAASIGSFIATIPAPAALPDLSGSISSVPGTVLPLSKKNTVVISVADSGARNPLRPTFPSSSTPTPAIPSTLPTPLPCSAAR